MRHLGGVLLALLAGCSSSSGPPPPGPVELEGAEHMRGFLSGETFARVGDDADRWTFAADGTFEAELAGVRLGGRWTADEEVLRLTQVTEDGAPAAARELTLGWLDGKLNIEIDGAQYRRAGGFLGR